MCSTSRQQILGNVKSSDISFWKSTHLMKFSSTSTAGTHCWGDHIWIIILDLLILSHSSGSASLKMLSKTGWRIMIVKWSIAWKSFSIPRKRKRMGKISLTSTLFSNFYSRFTVLRRLRAKDFSIIISKAKLQMQRFLTLSIQLSWVKTSSFWQKQISQSCTEKCTLWVWVT